jgi:DNA helicase-2/ATP-dependent DNA helicase PcrA
VIGGPRFYERAEIRDALAYLRLVNQSADDLAFERIVNTPKRGLGDATLKLLHDHGRANRVSLMDASRAVVETDALKPKPRGALRDVIAMFDRWRGQRDNIPHNELAEIVLDESGYTEMWQKDRSADAAGRLENLKELVRSMQQFENLQGFLEHVSLVMDTEGGADADAVSIMTLHSSKGLEFNTVFLPGWEEGLFPHQRALDEQGRAGLEEERRLAHVGITRARRRAHLYFATNRRVHGLWQSNVPSRFLDELPAANVEVTEAKGSFGFSGYAASRFDAMDTYASSYTTPGWQRAQARRDRRGAETEYEPDEFANQDTPALPARVPPSAPRSPRRAPITIEGELVAKSTGPSTFGVGDRVFHQKFGNGNVTHVDGNKLTIRFDHAGEKRIVDSFVTPV